MYSCSLSGDAYGLMAGTSPTSNAGRIVRDPVVGPLARRSGRAPRTRRRVRAWSNGARPRPDRRRPGPGARPPAPACRGRRPRGRAGASRGSSRRSRAPAPRPPRPPRSSRAARDVGLLEELEVDAVRRHEHALGVGPDLDDDVPQDLGDDGDRGPRHGRSSARRARRRRGNERPRVRVSSWTIGEFTSSTRGTLRPGAGDAAAGAVAEGVALVDEVGLEVAHLAGQPARRRDRVAVLGDLPREPRHVADPGPPVPRRVRRRRPRLRAGGLLDEGDLADVRPLLDGRRRSARGCAPPARRRPGSGGGRGSSRRGALRCHRYGGHFGRGTASSPPTALPSSRPSPDFGHSIRDGSRPAASAEERPRARPGSPPRTAPRRATGAPLGPVAPIEEGERASRPRCSVVPRPLASQRGSSSTSPVPPAAVARTGVPEASASRTTFGRPFPAAGEERAGLRRGTSRRAPPAGRSPDEVDALGEAEPRAPRAASSLPELPAPDEHEPRVVGRAGRRTPRARAAGSLRGIRWPTTRTRRPASSDAPRLLARAARAVARS